MMHVINCRRCSGNRGGDQGVGKGMCITTGLGEGRQGHGQGRLQGQGQGQGQGQELMDPNVDNAPDTDDGCMVALTRWDTKTLVHF